MKVLFPLVGDSIGGSHWSVIELCRELKKIGVDVLIVIHKSDGKLSSFFKDNDISFVVFPINKLAGESPSIFKIIFSMLTNFYKIYSFIKINKCDIVHGNDLRINLTWSLPAIFAKQKFIWHQRTILSSSIFWYMIPLLSTHFISISNFAMNTAPKIIKPVKKSLILNPFDTSFLYDYEVTNQLLKKKYKLDSKSKLIGYVGRIQPYKNISFLLEAFASLFHLNELNIKLLVIGDGSSSYINELKMLTENLNIEKNVIFCGFYANPMEAISALDILVAPSTIDAFGRTLVEAMLQNTPIIAANHAGHSEIINDGFIDFHYEHGDTKSLISGMSTLLNKKSTEVDRGDARSHAIKKYSSSKHANKVMNIYKKLMN
jgi:glycosyltransferase involved in cell wall biosynthesis